MVADLNEEQGTPGAIWSLVVATIAISFAAIFFVKAQPTHPLVSAGLRLTIAAAVMFPVSAQYFKSMPKAALWKCVLAGLCYATHFGAWVWSLMLTSVAASTTLVTATPLLLGLIGWLTGQDRPTKTLWVSLGLACVGIVLISQGSGQSGSAPMLGNGLALLGALGMVGYLLLARQLAQYNPWTLLSIASGVGGGVLLFTAACLGIPIEAASSDAFFWIVMATLIPQLIGHTALTYSLRYAPPTAVAMATVAEPAGAAILAWLILAETVTIHVMIGCAITLFAVASAARSGH
ncbi:MAG: DMT family transporter [Myxococcota bacterium]|nr:DMT family transporter [Myxococcota bacterium]